MILKREKQIGKTFGIYKVLSIVSTSDNRIKYNCFCNDCKNEIFVFWDYLKTHRYHTKCSCEKLIKSRSRNDDC